MAIASRAAGADDKLGQHDRQACQDDKAQVNEDKRGTAVLADQVRETPEVTQTHGRSGHSDQNAERTGERITLGGLIRYVFHMDLSVNCLQLTKLSYSIHISNEC